MIENLVINSYILFQVSSNKPNVTQVNHADMPHANANYKCRLDILPQIKRRKEICHMIPHVFSCMSLK